MSAIPDQALIPTPLYGLHEMSQYRRRRINYRLAVLMLAVIALLGSGVYLVHRFQLSRRAGLLVAEATAKEKAGDFLGAATVWQRFLTLHPENIEVRARYADSLDRGAKSPQEKLTALEKIGDLLQLDPERIPLRRRAVTLAMELAPLGFAKYEDARRHIEALINASPPNATLFDLLGQCFEAENNFMQAAESYKKALDHDPKAIDTADRLATLLADKLKDSQKATAVWDDMVKADNKSAKVYLKRARYRSTHGLAGSQNDFDRARELDPDNADVILYTVQADFSTRPDAARAEIKRGLNLYPDDRRFLNTLVSLEVRNNRFPEAIAAIREGLKKGSDQNELRGILANLLQQDRQFEEANKIIKELRNEKNIDPAVLDYLETNNLVFKQDWVGAYKKLNDVIPRLRTKPDLQRQARLVRGTCYSQIGDNEQSKNDFRDVGATLDPADPAWSTCHLQLAGALLALGQIDEALDEYNRVLSTWKMPAVSGIIANILLGRALGTPEAKRNWAPVDKAIDDAAKQLPDAPEVPLMRSTALLARGKAAEARAEMESARGRWPERIEPWIAIFSLTARERQFADAEVLLKAMSAKFGDRPAVRLVKARLLTDREGPAAAPKLAELKGDIAAFKKDQKLVLFTGLADAYLRIGLVKEGREVWDLVTQLEPDNLNIWMTEFDLASANSDDAGMARALANLKRIQGEDGTLFLLGNVFKVIQQHGRDKKIPLDDAYRNLEKAAARSNSSRVLIAHAELDNLNRNFAEAAQNYLKAIELGEPNPLVIRKAIVLLYQQGRFTDADNLARKLRDLGALTDDLNPIACELALRENDFTRALDLAKEPVKAGSQKISDHLRLGQVLAAAAGQIEGKNKDQLRSLTDEADRTFRHTLELPGDTNLAWASYLQFLVRNGRRDKAEVAFKEYQQKFSDRTDPLTLAESHDLLGHIDEAQAQYKTILAAKPDDPTVLRSSARFALKYRRNKDAEPLLLRLISLKEAAPADAAWARNALGVLLASVGQYRESAQALKVLGINESDDTSALSLEDRRTNAKVLALQTSPKLRKRAVKILERLVNEKSATDADRFLLAQLYDGQDEWARARELMLPLLTSKQADPNHVAHFANRLLARHEFNEAATFILAIEKLEPRSFRTLALKARLLHSQDKNPQAIDLVNAFLNDPAGVREVFSAAELFEQMEIPSSADKLFSKLAEKPGDPLYVLAYAGFLGRQGRLEEALDRCESVTGKASPEEIAATAVKFLFAKPQDESRLKRFEVWLNLEIEKAPAKISLQFDLANLYILTRRYDEAEKTYRKYTSADAKLSPALQSLALNNLAWLLALHHERGGDGLELIDRAIQIEGQRPELLDTRGLVYLSQRKFDQALDDFKESAANLVRPETYLHMSQAYLGQNNRTLSAEMFQKARAVGLDKDTLDPIERAAYDKMIK